MYIHAEHQTSFPNDMRGGGERSCLLEYNRDTGRWVGELSPPIPARYKWRVALRSCCIPSLKEDSHDRTISIILEEPALAEDAHLFNVNHTETSIWYKRTLSGWARGELRWCPLEETKSDIRKVSVIIRTIGGKKDTCSPEYEQKLHLVFEFDIIDKDAATHREEDEDSVTT